MPDFTLSQKYALCASAQNDGRLTALERAGARLMAEALAGGHRVPVPGLLAGPFLTADGLVAVREILPEPGPSLFAAAAADLLRRLRGRGYPCAAVKVEARGEGWRVSWAGCGFLSFSRRSPSRAHAEQNREELLRCALGAGLCLEEETDTGCAYVPRQAEAVVEEDETDDPFGRVGLTTLDRANRLAALLLPLDRPSEELARLAHLPARRVMTEGEVDLLLLEAGREARGAA